MSAEKIPHTYNTQDQQDTSEEQGEPRIIDKSSNNDGKQSSTLIEMPDLDSKLMTARDINTKMGELEAHFETLTKDFSEAQGDLAATIRSLRSRNARLNKEIEKVGVNASESASKQAKLSSALEQRIQGKLNTLTGGLEEAKEMSVELSNQLELLASAQTAFEAMQQRLEKRADAKDLELKALTEASFQKIQANKAHIEGLNALHKDQKSSLTALSEDHDSLTLHVDIIADKVANLELDTASHWRSTRKGFKMVAGVGAGVTIALASTMAWFEINPTSMPEFAKTQMASLSSSVFALNSSLTELKTETAQQAEARTQLMSDIASLKAQFAELETNASVAGENNATRQAALNTQVEAVSGQLGHLTATLAAVQKGMDDLKFQVEGPGNKNGKVTTSLVPLQNASWVAQRDPAHYSIQLVGAYEQNHLVSYVNQNESALKGALLSFNKSQHIKRDWYNLYYGDFASFAAAQRALAALPLRLKTNYPWVRSFSAIQKGAVK